MKRTLTTSILTAALLLIGGMILSASQPMVTVCHMPPAHPFFLTISEDALPAHLAHGDSLQSDCLAGGSNPQVESVCACALE